PRRRGRGLRMRAGGGFSVVTAHGLAPPADLARSRPRAGTPPRNLGLLPARARCGRNARPIPGRLTNALFVCIGNAGRSQMAQAIYERAGEKARSAGTWPSPEVHPNVVEAMKDVGIDLTGRTPRKLEADDVEWAEVVVTMGCGDE